MLQGRQLAMLFDARPLRERVLIIGAVLVLLLALWDRLLMQPQRDAMRALRLELHSTSEGLAASGDADDPRALAIRRAGELQLQSQNLDARIAGSAQGFVPAQQMTAVLHDVLRRQGRLTLVSIRNLPVTSLVAPGDAGEQNAAEVATVGTAPYVHSIELVVDGSFADVQAYMRELESLPWKFRFSLLELSAKTYPLNRVRLELSTLSMDATWLGV
jgi:MSHA biogenesis protein MshJ